MSISPTGRTVGQVIVGLWLLRTGWRERVEERSALQRPRSEDAPGH